MALELSLGGQPLVLPDINGNVVDAIERLQSTELLGYPTHPCASWEPISYEPNFPSTIDINPPNWPTPPKLRINEIYWPVTGASRYAYGYLLVCEDQWSAIKTGSESIEPFLFSAKSGPLAFTAQLYPLQPRPLVSGPGNQTVYILPVVDERFFWQYQPFNPSDFAEIDTWTKLIEAFKSLVETHSPLFVDTAVQDVLENGSADLLGPDRQQLVTWNPLGPVIDAAMATLGLRYTKAPGKQKIWAPDTLNAEARYSLYLAHPCLIGGGQVDTRSPDQLRIRYFDGQTPMIQNVFRLGDPADLENSPAWVVGINSSLNHDDAEAASSFYQTIGQRFFQWRQLQYDFSFGDLIPFDVVDGFEDAYVYSLGVYEETPPHNPGIPASPHKLVDQGKLRLKTRLITLPPNVVNHHNLVEFVEKPSSSSGSSISESSESSESSACVFADLQLWICCSENDAPSLMQYESELNRFTYQCGQDFVHVYEDQVVVGESSISAGPGYDWKNWCDSFCLEVFGVLIGSNAEVCNCPSTSVSESICETLGIDATALPIRPLTAGDKLLAVGADGCIFRVGYRDCDTSESV